MIDTLKTTDTEKAELLQRGSVEADKIKEVGLNISLLFLCFVASFVSFWDVEIAFDLNKLFSISFVTVLLYIITVTVFRSKYDTGLYKGRETEPYKKAVERFDTLAKEIADHLLVDRLRDWCNDFRRKDLADVRYNIISPFMTYAEYEEKYLNLSNAQVNRLRLNRSTKKAIKRANKVTPADLTSDMLLSRSFSTTIFGKRKILPKSGEQQRERDLLLNYVNAFIRTFICGMFVVSIASDPTLDTFIQWLIRMVPIIMAFVTAPAAGYRNITDTTTRRINAQSGILDVFFADKSKEDAEAEKKKAEEKLRAVAASVRASLDQEQISLDHLVEYAAEK